MTSQLVIFRFWLVIFRFFLLFFFRSPTLNLKNPVNQLIKKFWPYSWSCRLPLSFLEVVETGRFYLSIKYLSKGHNFRKHHSTITCCGYAQLFILKSPMKFRQNPVCCWWEITQTRFTGPTNWQLYSLNFCLFDLILNIPVNNFSVMSGRVFLCWTRT